MIGNALGRIAMADKMSVNQLKEALQNKTLPAYIAIPLIEEKMDMQDRMQKSAMMQQASQQVPIADRVMQRAAMASGIDTLPTNLAPAQGMAGGGIVAFEGGGEVPGFAAGIPPGLFDALIQAESRGRQSAVSSKGARGVAQLMPGTMRDPGYGIKPVRDDSEAENRRVGEAYLSAMLKKYRGNIDQALAAYNWGPGNVDKHLKKYGELISEKLPKETRAYIPKVKNLMAQQDQRRPEPVRVASREAIEGAMDVPAARGKIGVSSLLRAPLERITNLLPSAQAEEISKFAMDMPAGINMIPLNYAGGGIASFAGNQGSVVQETSSPVGRFFSPIPRTLNKIFAPFPEAVRAYDIQQDIDAQILQKIKEINQLGGMFGLAQQTPEQQRLYDQKKDELRALYDLKKTGKAPAPQAATPQAAKPQAAAPASGIKAEPPQAIAYPVKGGFETVTPDQFPLQNALEMGARRREGFAPAQTVDGSGAGEETTFTPPPVRRKESDDDFVGQARRITESVYPASEKPTELTVDAAFAQSKQFLDKAGVDLDVFKKQAADIKAERAGFAKDKEEAKTMRILEAAAGILSGTSPFAAVNIGKGMTPAIQGLGLDIKEFQKNERALRAAERQLYIDEQKFNLTRASDAQAQMFRSQDRLDRYNERKVGLIGDITGRLISNAGSEKVAGIYTTGNIELQKMRNAVPPDVVRLADRLKPDMPNSTELERLEIAANLLTNKGLSAIIGAESKAAQVVEEAFNNRLLMNKDLKKINEKAEAGDLDAKRQIKEYKDNILREYYNRMPTLSSRRNGETETSQTGAAPPRPATLPPNAPAGSVFGNYVPGMGWEIKDKSGNLIGFGR